MPNFVFYLSNIAFCDFCASRSSDETTLNQLSSPVRTTSNALESTFWDVPEHPMSFGIMWAEVEHVQDGGPGASRSWHSKSVIGTSAS